MKMIIQRIKRKKIGKPEFTVEDMGNGLYNIIINEEAKKDYGSHGGGPWKIYDHSLAVRLWEPNFNPLMTTIDKITAWVRLSRLLIELYSEKILRKIGDLVGKTCKIDYNTSHLCWRKFARLCIEVDLTQPLIGRYMKAQISNETNTRESLSKSHNKQNQEGNIAVAEAQPQPKENREKQHTNRGKVSNIRNNHIENCIAEDDATPTSDQHHEQEDMNNEQHQNPPQIKEHKPPDLDKQGKNRSEDMETHMQHDIENLVKNVNFTTPIGNKLRQLEATDMQLN
ncbi:hypothetical protein AHAS_Ahas05G0217500 [Arachis hypogaea]